MHDGLATSIQLYSDDASASPAVASALQIAVLPVLALVNILFLQRFFRPWLQRTMHESKRMAELLAQLPREVNVEALVQTAMGGEAEQAAPQAKPKKAAEARQGLKKTKKNTSKRDTTVAS